MPSKVELLALSSLLLQCIPSTLAHPAGAGFWPWDNDESSNALNGLPSSSSAREVATPYPYPVFVTPENGLNQLAGGGPDKDKDHCGGAGGGKGSGSWGDKGHDGGKVPTVTVTDCTATTGNLAPTATTTVTVTTDGSGSGTATITKTITEDGVTSTETSTKTITTDLGTITETATLTETTSDCTATSTDYTTLTTPGPTVTSTITTPGPTVTETTTEAAETVTEPGVTETTTETRTETLIDTVTDTITSNQIITSTETATKTDTLEITVTSTVTSPDCSSTPNNGGLDDGECSDPTIKWEYGLDGRTEYSYTTNNQKDFPFGSSPTIGSVTDLICNRLRSPCNAPQETIDQCYTAQDAVSGLEGQEAADVWNELMT